MKPNQIKGTLTLLVVLTVFLMAVAATQGFFLYKIYRNTTSSQPAGSSEPIELVPNAAPAPSTPVPPTAQGPSAAPTPWGMPGWDPDDTWWGMGTWDPFGEFQRMQDRMNRLFDDSFGRFRQAPGYQDRLDQWSFAPRLDVQEEGDRYVVRMDVPGAEPSNISVNIKDRQLTVSGEVNETVEKKEGNQVLRKERRSGSFQRSLTLPGPVEADAMTAEYKDGVLTVTVPKGKEADNAKTITIKQNQELADMLEAARIQVKLAQSLGYRGKKQFQPILDEIEGIKENTQGGKSGRGFFEAIGDKIADL